MTVCLYVLHESHHRLCVKDRCSPLKTAGTTPKWSTHKPGRHRHSQLPSRLATSKHVPDQQPLRWWVKRESGKRKWHGGRSGSTQVLAHWRA